MTTPSRRSIVSPFRAFVIVAFVLVVIAAIVNAHEGHDHNHGNAPASQHNHAGHHHHHHHGHDHDHDHHHHHHGHDHSHDHHHGQAKNPQKKAKKEKKAGDKATKDKKVKKEKKEKVQKAEKPKQDEKKPRAAAHNHNHHHGHNHGQNAYVQYAMQLIEYLPKDPFHAAITVLSAISGLSIFFVAILPTNLPATLLNGLVSFAVGAVLGDVFLHSIPEIMSIEEVDENGLPVMDGDMGYRILGGLLLFFVIGKLTKIMGAGHHHHHGDHEHVHEHEHEHDHKKNDGENETVESETSETETTGRKSGLRKRKSTRSAAAKEDKPVEAPKKKEVKTHTHSHDHSHDHAHSHESNFSPILFFIASCTHAFTDGITLGLSFLSGVIPGFTTSLAIFFHEAPHRLGDYAILISNGFSKSRAMGFVVLSSLGTWYGVGFVWLVTKFYGSHTEDLDLIKSTLSPFAAGGLIYMALVEILPELMHTKKGWKGFFGLLVQVVGLWCGANVMKLIACDHGH